MMQINQFQFQNWHKHIDMQCDSVGCRAVNTAMMVMMWTATGVDDLLSDAELDISATDDGSYGSLTAPKIKVVQRCL